MRKLFSSLTWPSCCAVCGAWPSTPVCDECHHTHAQLRPRCPGCGLRLAPGLERCSACANHATEDCDPTSVHARVDYGHPWSTMVQQLKFQQSPATARVMAQMMLEDAGVDAMIDACNLLVPVPLTMPGLLERGYNQSWELIRHLRRQHGNLPPACPDLLTRADSGPAIHALPRAERLLAAANLFTIHPERAPLAQGADVLLVDDVLTTGATARAATQVLRAAGARSVHLWVFARTPAPNDEGLTVE